MKRFICIAMLIILVLVADISIATNDGFSTSYTYNYDFWSSVQESPDAYRVTRVINSASLGLDVLMKNPQSIFVRDNSIYIVDTGNNRILHVQRNGENFQLVREITEIKGTDVSTLNNPQDVFVDAAGNVYIADTSNERVVMVNDKLELQHQYVKPIDATFDQEASFQPKKIAVDVAGRVYALVTNVNKGLAKFEHDGSFSGFIGANKVSVTIGDYIWKRYFQTAAQRAQSENFVPTEYSNLYMDGDGFIYVVTNVFDEYDLLFDAAKPIRRLNGIGDDILIKKDKYPPIGDLLWDDTDGPSKLIDITVLDQDIYVVFDRTRGRIFGYDSQGIMLWAFGTKGNQDGAFTMPAAIDHMGYDLLCLDQNESSITVFTPTAYGQSIFRAIELYSRGDYVASADEWREVMKLNANYNLAFIGVGRALLRQDQYTEAMTYFKHAHDRENYGRTFKLYRKEWVEANIFWIILILVVAVMIPLILKRIKGIKEEVEAHERIKTSH